MKKPLTFFEPATCEVGESHLVEGLVLAFDMGRVTQLAITLSPDAAIAVGLQLQLQGQMMRMESNDRAPAPLPTGHINRDRPDQLDS
jgi:hypothetical protein